MNIYIIRHGETDWNVAWRLQGATDTPLNEKGLLQAKEAAKLLADTKLDAIFSSPLKRAYVTADIIAGVHGIEVIVDDRLIEMCFGKYEGTTPDYAKIDKNRELLFSSPCDYEASDGAESFEQVIERCRLFIEELTSRKDINNVLIVAHGALIKGIQQVMFDEPLSKFWETPPLNNCVPVLVEYRDGQFIWR